MGMACIFSARAIGLQYLPVKQGACKDTSLGAETLGNGKLLLNRLSLRST